MMETRENPNQIKTADEKKKDRKAKMPLYLVVLTVFIDLIGFGLIIPVMPSYAEQFHADPTMVTVVIAAYSVMQFLLTPFWGRLSDRIGRRPVLLISLTASAIGYLVWGFSNSIAMLLAARIIAGAGNANMAVAQAYVADVTSTEERAVGMGMVGAAFGLGFVLGPALGLLFVGFGLSAVGFVAAAFSIIDLIFTFFMLPEPEKHSEEASQRFTLGPSYYFKTLGDAKLTASLAIFFFSTFAFALMEATLVMLTEKQFGFSPKENFTLFTYIGLLIVFVQGGLMRRLAKKTPEKKLIGAGALLVATGLLLTPATTSVPVLAVALGFLAFGSGINTPSNQSLLSKLADSKQVGGVMGVGQSLATLGRILGPIVGGVTFQYLGMGVPYVVGAVVMALVFVLSLKLPQAA